MIWARLATDFGDFLCASAVALVAALWAWRALSRLTAIAFVLSYGFAVAAVAGCKWLSGQMFEDVSVTVLTHFSRGAPSGHAALSVLVYGAVAYFCTRGKPNPTGLAGLIVCLLIIGAVLFTRVFLGSHTIADVAAGVPVGALALCLPVLVSRAQGEGRPQLSPAWLLLAAAASCAIVMLSGIRVENDFGLL